MAKNSGNKNSGKGGSGLPLNKISFFTICVVAVLYLLAALLGVFNINIIVIGVLQSVATAFLVIIASVNAWRYVANRGAVWIVLYIIVLIIVIVGIVLPLVL